jgi:hypothetical protein
MRAIASLSCARAMRALFSHNTLALKLYRLYRLAAFTKMSLSRPYH